MKGQHNLARRVHRIEVLLRHGIVNVLQRNQRSSRGITVIFNQSGVGNLIAMTQQNLIL